MKQAAIWLLLGMAAGFGVHALFGGADGRAPAGDDAGEWTLRLDRLESALAEERAARRRLAATVDALADALAAPASADAVIANLATVDAATAAAPGEVRPVEETANTGTDSVAGDRRRPDVRGRLVEGGFAPQRAAYIAERIEQLSLEAMQARYDAVRNGQPAGFRDLPAPEDVLRAELGDDEYTRYLDALGRPSDVRVGSVIGSSPADVAGLRAGDRIVGYAGTRVFGMPDLQRLTFEGQPGETVTVDVLRDGQTIQLYLPRGPLGITGGGFRRRP